MSQYWTVEGSEDAVEWEDIDDQIEHWASTSIDLCDLASWPDTVTCYGVNEIPESERGEDRDEPGDRVPCRRTGEEREINLMEWIHDNRPDWLEVG